jgi:hypothetical protein
MRRIMARIARWWSRTPAQERVAVLGLAGILVAGAALRITMMVAWQPAFMGWPDAKSYLDVAHGELFGNVLRPAGYPMFLRVLDGFGLGLTGIVAVNHALGLGAAVLLYLAVGAAGGPPLIGLLPAAVVALNGDGVFLEHSPLSEPLFTFLVALALYGAVRTLHRPGAGWPVVVGLALACATVVRVVGEPLLLAFAAWLALASYGPWRQRLRTTAIAAAAAVALLGAYTVAEYASVGTTGLSRHGAWHLYARVAAFADCSKFDPPPGTRVLCESTPPGHRAGVDGYLFKPWDSPAFRAFGDPFQTTDAETAEVGAFARAAIVHQPLDYLREVGADALRYVAPESMRRFGGGPSYADLVGGPILFNRQFQDDGLDAIRAYYDPAATAYTFYPGVLDVLRGYESATRIQGPLMIILALLSLTGPLSLRGRPRAAALLFALTAWILLLAPVAALEFSARTAVPGFGALGAAAAAAAWGHATALSSRRKRGQTPRRATRTLVRPDA